MNDSRSGLNDTIRTHLSDNIDPTVNSLKQKLNHLFFIYLGSSFKTIRWLYRLYFRMA